MREQDSTKMEFLLKVNGNIIVQRFFNVRGYLPENNNSIELHEFMEYLIDDFKKSLRVKTATYMLDNQYEIYENPEIMETSITDGPEQFLMEIKNGEKMIYQRYIDAKVYPPKVRYTVDIRPKLKSILTSLTKILSSKKNNYNYLEYNLKF